ncbi:hypothetical protein EV385_6565 [Krasilnikovia cinnamomea]|uniref:Uncharacterized protein n=1 Tax=Krasilnikovia cinnamomea TaxID=349313 RepID=A0A4Q7ZUF1_9ACTN|nr:hypothetical protein EV385_6565 [Krasilnikovia cinnamomea]
MNPCLGPLIDPPDPSAARIGGSPRPVAPAHRPAHSSGARPEKPVATRTRACRVLPLPGYRKT